MSLGRSMTLRVAFSSCLVVSLIYGCGDANKVTESDQRELFQSVAPEVERGLYLVPKVIE